MRPKFGQQFEPLSNGPYGTAGIGDGMMGQRRQGMGQLPDIQNMPSMQMAGYGETPIAKPKFNPWDIVGAAGDALASYGGLGTPYSDNKQRQQSEMKAEELYKRRNADDWSNFIRQETYKRDNPAPQQPRVNDTEVDYNFWKAKRDNGEITPDQFNDKLFAPRYIVDPATGQTMKIGGSAPTVPIGKLTPIGGPAQQVPGNFRR